MGEKRDPTHLGLNWPDAYGDILPVLRREWGVDGKIYLTRQLGGGKSGALVFFVDISTKTFTGQAVLKLDHAFDPTQQEQHEAALHARAIEDAPKFAAMHLPKVLHSAHHGNQLALLSTIAGRGLEYVDPWLDCSYDRRLESIRKVSVDLLEFWNSDYRLIDGLKMPQELLQSWLAYRLDPAHGGRIHEFFDACGIPCDTPTIVHDGQWYPNPLAFAVGARDIPKRLRLRGATGHCHGDFHGLNLLVGRRQKERLDYYLIDLAMYQSEQYLFYDHANFELASLLFARGNASAKDWEAVIAHLSHSQHNDELPELRTDDIGLIELVRELRHGVSAWIERHEADRLSFMESQTLLARVAAGLLFSHKRLSLKERQMAFFYAAANLKDYLKLHRLDWPKTGAVFEIGATSPAPQDKKTTAVAAHLPPTAPPKVTPANPLTGTQSASRSRYVARFAIPGVIATLLIALLALMDYQIPWPQQDSARQTQSRSPTSTPAPAEMTEARASLAVLPFKNLSTGVDDSFADGLSIDIASVFARTGRFRMPGMTSAFQFKDRLEDSRAIGQALNVNYLLEGTVLRSGDDLRISASLVRAEDGLLIWSRTFTETMGNVFVTQEKIAEAIGAALSTPLNVDADILEAQRTNNPRAYELFVRGLALLEQRGLALEDAKAVLERAVNLQPNFAAAWGALSLVYNVIPTFVKEIDGRPVSTLVYYRKAKEAALRAQQIDRDLPLVQHALAYMYQRDRQWVAAENAYEAALRNDPYAHRVMLTYAALLYTVGKRDQARAMVDRARDADPLNELYKLWAAFMRWQDDQTEQTIKPIEDIFLRLPQYREIALRIIIDHRARTGELDKARDLIESCGGCSEALRSSALSMLSAASAEPAEQLFRAYKDSNIMGYQFLYALGGADITLDAFRYYGVDANRRLVFFTVPWMLVDELTQDERFIDIAKDMGLVDYWRARGYPDNCTLVDGGRFKCNGRDSQSSL